MAHRVDQGIVEQHGSGRMRPAVALQVGLDRIELAQEVAYPAFGRAGEAQDHQRRQQHPRGAQRGQQNAEARHLPAAMDPHADHVAQGRLLAATDAPADFVEARHQHRSHQQETGEGSGEQVMLVPADQRDGGTRQQEGQTVQHAGQRGLPEIAPAGLQPPKRAAAVQHPDGRG